MSCTDYDRFELVFTEDSRFPLSVILSEASDSYLDLKGLDASIIGCEIDSIYNYQDIVYMREMLAELSRCSESFTFFKNIGGVVWNVCATFSDNDFHFIGHRVDHISDLFDLSLSCRISHLSLGMLQRTCSSAVLFREACGQLFLESASTSLSEITCIPIGGEISGMVGHMFCLDPKKTLLACQRDNTVVRYLDTYIRGGILYHMLIECFPVCCEPRHVLIETHMLSKDQYYRLQMPYMGIVSDNSSMGADSAYGIVEYRDGRAHVHNTSRSCAELLGIPGVLDTVVDKLVRPSVTSGTVRCNCVFLNNMRYLGTAVPSIDGQAAFLTLVQYDELRDCMDNALEGLSPREKEVTRLLVSGCTSREIAAALTIAEGTVKKTVYNIYGKIGVSSKVELINFILQHR